MRVCFICRGYPGLGKVGGTVGIDALLREVYAEKYESVFLSYYGGCEYLKSTGHQVMNILSDNMHIGRNSFCSPFGPETKKCVEIITGFAPDAVFNDGEPYLIEVTEDILNIPTIILAHPSDLDSPTNTKLAVDIVSVLLFQSNPGHFPRSEQDTRKSDIHRRKGGKRRGNEYHHTRCFLQLPRQK